MSLFSLVAVASPTLAAIADKIPLWAIPVPLGAIVLLVAPYRRFAELDARSVSQDVLNDLSVFRGEACKLLAECESGAALDVWDRKIKAWERKVEQYLRDHLPSAVAERFKYVGIHKTRRLRSMDMDRILAMSIVDNRVKFLEQIIGDGIARR